MDFRPLTESDLWTALLIADQEWIDCHDEFVREFRYSLEQPNSPIRLKFYGMFDRGVLRACGCVADSTANFVMATLSWIVVDQRHRYAGLGRTLVQNLEGVARGEMQKGDMLFSTSVPEFYNKLGYATMSRLSTGNILMHKVL